MYALAKKAPFSIACAAFFILYGLFYVGNTLSPSSYGIEIQSITGKFEGLFWGKPRLIRSDEWSIITPMTQSVVREKFNRYNTLSPYKEDFRIGYSMPIKDWALIFKPTMLGYFFLPPEYAYSLNYFLIQALFITGYAFLFIAFSFSSIQGVCFALLLYFSGFVQAWWTTVGVSFAYFPWLYLTFIWKKPLIIRSMVFYYLATCMMFGFFYPVIQYTLAFSALTYLYSYNRNTISFGKLSIFVCMGLLAFGSYIFYIRDEFSLLANTIYPGHRQVMGGEVTIMQWISQIFPIINMNVDHALSYNRDINFCEISTVGSYLLLMMLSFGKWKRWFSGLKNNEFRSLLVMVIALSFISTWQLFSISPALASLIKLDRVPGRRWFFASGLILLGALALILKRLEIELSWHRTFIFISLVCFSLFLTSNLYHVPIITDENLNIIFLVVSLFILFKCSIIKSEFLKDAVIIVALINNIMIFNQFNPLQSAKPIFHLEKSISPELLRKDAIYTDEGFVINQMSGSVANGLGLPALNHVLYNTKLDFFHCYFPDMPDVEFNNIFNRYARVTFSDKIDMPETSFVDSIVLPMQPFLHNKNVKILRACLKDGRYI